VYIGCFSEDPNLNKEKLGILSSLDDLFLLWFG